MDWKWREGFIPGKSNVNYMPLMILVYSSIAYKAEPNENFARALDKNNDSLNYLK
jgi:hypothetical protein